MTTKVIRLNPLRRWSALLAGLVGIVFLIWFLGLIIGPFPFEQNPMQSIMAFPVIMLLLLILLLVFVMWMIWSYSIEFSETGLRIGKYGNPIARRTNILYSDIKHIRRGTYRGWIEIVLLNGKSFILMTIVAGGSDGLIAELEKHIPMECFQPSLRKEMKRYSKSDLARWGFPIFIWLILLLQWSPRMILPNVAWKTEWGTGFLPMSHVDNYWIENDGTAWVSVMDIGSTAQVIRINGDEKMTWKLEDDKIVLYADAVVADSSEQPWLIHRDKLFHWSNSSWKTILLDGHTIRPTSSVVVGNIFWATASQSDQSPQFLMKLNLDSGIIDWVQIPSQMVRDSFYLSDIALSPNGSIVVSIVKKEYPKVYFYAYNSDQWESLNSLDTEWIVPEKMKKYPTLAVPVLQYETFALDAIGQLWVLNHINNQLAIGRFNNDTTQWEWSYLEPECEVCFTEYRNMVIDKSGRIWLEGEYGKVTDDMNLINSIQPFGLDVYTPRFGTEAEHLIRYTPGNSNYQVGIDNTGLKLSSDGRVWVAGDRLVWMDGNDSKLPGTMPGWFAKITDPLVLMIEYLVGLVLMASLYLGIWIFGLIQKRKNRLNKINS